MKKSLLQMSMALGAIALGCPFGAANPKTGDLKPDSREIWVGAQWYYEGTVVGPKRGPHAPGERLTFTAVPKQGFRFKGWTGDLAWAEVDGDRVTIGVTDSTPPEVVVNAIFEKVKRPHVFSMSVKATSFATGGDLVTRKRRAWFSEWLATNGFTKVYLESYRHNVYAPTEVLSAARDELAAAGFEVCGLVTPTCLDLDPSATPQTGKYVSCFGNPRARERLKEEISRCARLFDTILIDDFLFANCPKTCAWCGDDSPAFRLGLVNAVSREIIAAARRENPNCHCIIKYPCWHSRWAAKGLVPAEQTAIFGECWVGSETRDAGEDPYWAFSAYDDTNGRSGGRCGGVWFDPLDSRPEKFLEQAYYSILGGAPETLVHCYDYMLGENGGTTPFGESFDRAHACGRLFVSRMDELRRLAAFCDAAERKCAKLKPNGVSRHEYVLSNALYVARLNTRAEAVDDKYGKAAPNEFAFPLKESEWIARSTK